MAPACRKGLLPFAARVRAAEVAEAARRAAVRTVTPLAFFIPCELKNYANHGGHWTGKAGYQRRLRDTTRVLVAVESVRQWGPFAYPDAAAPKCVTLEAHVWNYFDEHDGLRNACKPVVDGLVRARLLHDDAHDCGHQFLYTQVIDRTQRGVLVEIAPR